MTSLEQNDLPTNLPANLPTNDLPAKKEKTPLRTRQLDGREWWLWGFAVMVTLLLTAGIVLLAFGGEYSESNPTYWFGLREWVRGLAALVLLFDIYTMFQQLQLQRVRRQVVEQIELRDKLLCQQREQLEQQVVSRTSELLEVNAQLRQAEERYRAIFEDAVVGIFQMTPEGRPLSVNRALAHMHGFGSPAQFLSEITNVASQLFVDQGRMRELEQMFDEHGAVRGAEVEICRRDRTKKWTLWNMRGVRNLQGKVMLYEGMVEDVTDRKAAEEQIRFLAYYDALTGLPNRTLLQDRLAKALASARRRDEKVAVLFLDLDGFKIINDSLGHTLGDSLLQGVAERLKKWARDQDTVARIGGDEFVVALTAVKDARDAAIAAERFMDAMVPEFRIQGRSFNVRCSVGISLFPDHGADSETLIKNADAAMYCAKEGGRSSFRFFTEEMNAQVVERLTLEHALRVALEKKEMFLVYQPQMDVESGKIVGLEALLRWQHPEWGLIPPARFIPVAEHSGLIVPIGEWVLKTACSTARKWQEQHLPAIPIAVNVSALQFRHEGFLNLVKKVLAETGLNAQYLELELTESLLLSNADLQFPLLRSLKAMGVKLAIDDFGTGYSSLSYLRQFPVNKLKIDSSFIKDVPVDSDGAAITAAIISMARGLNLRVIAEGVETEAQMSFLRQHHCDEIQGHFFSKPLGLDEISEKLRSAPVQALSASAR